VRWFRHGRDISREGREFLPIWCATNRDSTYNDFGPSLKFHGKICVTSGQTRFRMVLHATPYDTTRHRALPGDAMQMRLRRKCIVAQSSSFCLMATPLCGSECIILLCDWNLVFSVAAGNAGRA
jgi:hypothetical protein